MYLKVRNGGSGYKMTMPSDKPNIVVCQLDEKAGIVISAKTTITHNSLSCLVQLGRMRCVKPKAIFNVNTFKTRGLSHDLAPPSS